ncbi:hypothetical protein [uncultured Chitinophaga sp.]|uniref:hypothetical protein n=1 Tax=uncultured Chitinophaga sp. TaxID=339340 RepID=UPI0025DF19F8|nr:hypothetical protein [uncultured Chitinophaga sp.]
MRSFLPLVRHLVTFAAFWFITSGLFIWLYPTSEPQPLLTADNFEATMYMFLYCGIVYFHTMERTFPPGESAWHFRHLKLVAHILLIPAVILTSVLIDAQHSKPTNDYFNVSILFGGYWLIDIAFRRIFPKHQAPVAEGTE